MLLGALFVALLRYGREHSHASPVPAVYGGEALGSALGGVLLSLWLLEAANPVAILALGSAVAAGGALFAMRDAPRRERNRAVAAATALLAAVVLVLAFAGPIDLSLRNLQYRPFEVVESVDSKYGNLIVTARDGLHDFYESGALAFTVVDEMYAEETVHIPLLYHPRPRKVLLVGASGSGVIPESLKHPSVEQVDFVEIDPAIIGLAAKYGPPGWMGGNGRLVRPVLGDGRAYISATRETYDAIILAAGLPLSLQVNRLYTVEFFRAARGVLAAGGLIGLKVDAPGAYMGPELTGLVASLVNALERVFTHVDLLPGETIHIIASDEPLEARRKSLVAILDERDIETAYINRYFLVDRLSDLRAAQLDSLLALHDTGVANTDGQPATFSFALALWAKHFSTGKGVAWTVANLNLGTSVVLLAALALIAVAAYTRASGLGPGAAVPLVCLYSTGFTTMFTTVLLMLCFQISRGYVYTRLAVIIAAFMVALGLTATLAGRRIGHARERVSLPLLQAALVCLPVLVIAIFRYVQSGGAGLPGSAVDTVYILLAFLAGVVGAGVFMAASASLMRRRSATVEPGALAYSIDLVGASIAGFTTGFLTIPALGIVNAALAVAAVNLFLLSLLGVAIRRFPGPRSR
jgi:spermidine synthase